MATCPLGGAYKFIMWLLAHDLQINLTTDYCFLSEPHTKSRINLTHSFPLYLINLRAISELLSFAVTIE